MLSAGLGFRALSVADAGAGPDTFALLGVNGWRDDWTAADAIWSNMPNLAPLPNGVTIAYLLKKNPGRVAFGDSFVSWLGTSTQPQVSRTL